MIKIKKNKLKSGFTIVELLIAVFIVEVGLLAIVSFYAYTHQVTKAARLETTAANLASGLLDEELSVNYDNLSVGAGTQVAYSSDSANPLSAYQKKIDISYVDLNLNESYSPPDTNMKKIVVTISWTLNNEPKNIQISSIKAKH